MLILTIRTDKPEAEIGLYDGEIQLAYEIWQAHRALAETLHEKIAALLKQANTSLEDIKGIVYFKGPGSFTGLRIGAAVANALAYALHIPAAGAGGDDWQQAGMKLLSAGHDSHVVVPEYGAVISITTPRK